MMKWKIVVDSSANIRKLPDTSAAIDLEVVPFYLQIDDETIVDNSEIDFADLFAKFKTADKCTTACPSPATFAESFAGADNVLCFTITGGLSGCYNSAVNGRTMALEDNPEQNIFVFDSRSTGPEMDMLVEKAVEFIDAYDDFDEVVDALKAYHQHTRLVFILQSIDNLVTNGRVSSVAASIVGLLNLRLIGRRTDEGTIELAHRVRGNARVIKKTIAQMEEEGYVGGRIVLAEHLNPSMAEDFKKAVQAKYPNAEITIRPGTGLTAFYAEDGGLIVGYERQ
ncbi:DegV family protein [Allofustis seminis]|uniref:DegV family protein n=1 Tax=Allofustis seminis TaxID=166939 RepID=UPI00039D619F|nr:DegV family protein [Allofustis seminis]